MSLRARITLSFTCLFGVIVLGLAIGSYIIVRNSLNSDLNTELQVAVDGTTMSAEHELNEHETPAGGEEDLKAVLNARGHAALPNTQILVRQGSREAAYKSSTDATEDLRKITSHRLKTQTFRNLRIAFRSLTVRRFDAQYDIFAATSTAFVASRLRRFGIILVLLVPLGLLLAGTAGYFLARKLLAPLNDLSTTIDSVTSSDLGLRVTVAGSDDELSRIGRRFNSLLNRLQRAFDAQQRFMADASHELRTPVTVALAAAQVTERDPFRTREDSDEALRMVENQMLRVKNIVQQLLLLSQADASELKLDIKDVYLDDIVAEASRAGQALARVKQQHIEIKTLPEARIRGDADLLGQALMILVDNAVKFTPPGGSIEVGIEQRVTQWVCYVSDTGIGIPASAHSQVFDRFYRLKDASGKESNGSGLGLAIAKAIVEGHGGTLMVAESRPGFTRFEMSLRWENQESEEGERLQANSLAVRM